jgi:hypothetical protein
MHSFMSRTNAVFSHGCLVLSILLALNFASRFLIQRFPGVGLLECLCCLFHFLFVLSLCFILFMKYSQDVQFYVDSVELANPRGDDIARVHFSLDAGVHTAPFFFFLPAFRTSYLYLTYTHSPPSLLPCNYS